MNKIRKTQSDSSKISAGNNKIHEFISVYKTNLIFIAVILLAAIILFKPFYNLGIRSGINSVAASRLKADTTIKEQELENLKSTKAELLNEISELSQTIEDNSDINLKIKEHEDKKSELNSAINTAQALSDSLDKQLKSKQQTSNQVTSATSETSGASKTLKAGDYRCPGAISAGTYKISGKSGNIVLYDISNSVKVSKNLESIENNEFTLSISEGEKLKISKDVTVTVIKQNNSGKG